MMDIMTPVTFIVIYFDEDNDLGKSIKLDISLVKMTI